MSSPEADFALQGGPWIPQATRSSQTLFLPTSFVTLGLQWKEPTVMLNPDRFLYGKAWIFKLSGAWCCLWSAQPSVSSAWHYCSLFSVLLSRFTVHYLSWSLGLFSIPPLSISIRLSRFMALAIRSPCLFSSSPAYVDSPTAYVLGVPCLASAWTLGK